MSGTFHGQHGSNAHACADAVHMSMPGACAHAHARASSFADAQANALPTPADTQLTVGFRALATGPAREADIRLFVHRSITGDAMHLAAAQRGRV